MRNLCVIRRRGILIADRSDRLAENQDMLMVDVRVRAPLRARIRASLA